MATMTLRPNQPPPPNKVATNTIIISDSLWWWKTGNSVKDDNKYFLSIYDFTIDMFPRFDLKNLRSIRFSKVSLSSPNLMFKYKSTGSDVRVGDEIEVFNGELDKILYLDSPPALIDYVYIGNIECEFDIGQGYDSNSVLAIDVFRFSAYESIKHGFSTQNVLDVNTNRKFMFTKFHFSTMLGYYQNLHTSLMVNPNIILQMQQWFGTSGKIPYKIEIVKASNRIKYFGISVVQGQKIPINAIDSGRLTMDTQGLINEETFEFKLGNGYTGAFLLAPKI
ncbi:MAG: hypothetical protein LBE34_12600 [Flavobacteriaceae bacterium]|jgi:hypothetical protein|nr:hypothetical protein [Flavobacteriaceae bacterium]